MPSCNLVTKKTLQEGVAELNIWHNFVGMRPGASAYISEYQVNLFRMRRGASLQSGFCNILYTIHTQRKRGALTRASLSIHHIMLTISALVIFVVLTSWQIPEEDAMHHYYVGLINNALQL